MAAQATGNAAPDLAFAAAASRAFVVHPGNVIEARLPIPAGLPAGTYGVRVTTQLDGQAPAQHVLTVDLP